MKNADLLVVRLALAALLALKVLDDFFATALTAAYRLNFLGMAEGLGQLTAGDDYTRLIPLMDAAPWWLHGLWVLAGVLYLVAIVLILWGADRAYVPVLAAFGVEVIARLVERPVIAAAGVVVNPNPSVVGTVILPYVLPLLVVLVLALWRQTPAPAAPSG